LKKLLDNKVVAIFMVLLLVASLVWGLFYFDGLKDYNYSDVRLYDSSFVDVGSVDILSGQEVSLFVEKTEGVVFYEVVIELKDGNLESELPLEGEEVLDVEDSIFYDWNGMLRGVLVSVEPALDFFNAGDILMLEVDDDVLSMTLPGDVLTLYCEVKVPASMCFEEEDSIPSCLELLKLKNCLLVRVNH